MFSFEFILNLVEGHIYLGRRKKKLLIKWVLVRNPSWKVEKRENKIISGKNLQYAHAKAEKWKTIEFYIDFFIFNKDDCDVARWSSNTAVKAILFPRLEFAKKRNFFSNYLGFVWTNLKLLGALNKNIT